MLEINPDALEKTVDEFNNAVQEDRPFNEVIRDGRQHQRHLSAKNQLVSETGQAAVHCVRRNLRADIHLWRSEDRHRIAGCSTKPTGRFGGLYAAGELTAGFFYYNYPSGSGLLRGAVTGKIAGTNAAGR